MFVETTINTLPIELLSAIFIHVRNDREKGQESIAQCRLVSRRFRDHTSVFLINEITVGLSSESFTDLETIASHPFFSKGVKIVNIGVSYYEAELAQNKQIYMKEAVARLSRNWGMMKRTRQSSTLFDSRKGSDIPDDLFEWLGMIACGRNPDVVELTRGETVETPTPIQKLFLRMYDLYVARFYDQKALRKDNAHIGRLVHALSCLPRLVVLNLTDSHIRRSEFKRKGLGRNHLDPEAFEDTGYDRNVLQYFDSGIRQSSWVGSCYTNGRRRRRRLNGTSFLVTTPPVEMLGEFCSQLADKGIRPKAFRTSLSPPPDMRVLTMTSTQQENMKKLVSRASSLAFIFRFSSRPYTLKENPRPEMLALCSVTKPFFSAPNLKSLRICFNNYADTTPTVSLSEILPLETTWSRLKTLHLRYQPMTIDELRGLVSRQRETVRDLKLQYPWFLKDSLHDVLEAARGFSNLKDAIIWFPKGSDFGGTGGLDFEWPEGEVSRYLLRETDVYRLGDELV